MPPPQGGGAVPIRRRVERKQTSRRCVPPKILASIRCKYELVYIYMYNTPYYAYIFIYNTREYRIYYEASRMDTTTTVCVLCIVIY